MDMCLAFFSYTQVLGTKSDVLMLMTLLASGGCRTVFVHLLSVVTYLCWVYIMPFPYLNYSTVYQRSKRGS